jgi:hypothetical protein
VGALDLGLVPGAGAPPAQPQGRKFVYLLNADDFATLPTDAFVVYQGACGGGGCGGDERQPAAICAWRTNKQQKENGKEFLS